MGDKASPEQLKPESLALFREGISLVFSRWTALQMAIREGWGGRDSGSKSEQLATDVYNWFSQSTEPLYIDELEEMLAENMILLFNTEIEDGSDEEVAENLMIMHEEFLHGNYESIEKLRKSSSGAEAVSQSRQVVNDDDDDESSDDEASDMVVDEQKPKLNLTKKPSTVHQQEQSVEAEDGWFVVPSRRNRGKKH